MMDNKHYSGACPGIRKGGGGGGGPISESLFFFAFQFFSVGLFFFAFEFLGGVGLLMMYFSCITNVVFDWELELERARES